MNNIKDYIEHGRTYRQRLAEAEGRTLWTWRDVFEAVSCVILILLIIYLMYVIAPLVIGK